MPTHPTLTLLLAAGAPPSYPGPALQSQAERGRERAEAAIRSYKDR